MVDREKDTVIVPIAIASEIGNFINNTSGISSDAAYYVTRRSLMIYQIDLIVREMPQGERLTFLSRDEEDNWKRTPYIQTWDEEIYKLSLNYPNHPEVISYSNSRPYWHDFVETKQS